MSANLSKLADQMMALLPALLFGLIVLLELRQPRSSFLPMALFVLFLPLAVVGALRGIGADRHSAIRGLNAALLIGYGSFLGMVVFAVLIGVGAEHFGIRL